MDAKADRDAKGEPEKNKPYDEAVSECAIRCRVLGNGCLCWVLDG